MTKTTKHVQGLLRKRLIG